MNSSTNARLAIAIGVTAAVLAVIWPAIAFIALGVVAFIYCVQFPSVRLAVFIIGGALSLGSSADFGARKLAFLAVSVAIAGLSIVDVTRTSSRVGPAWSALLVASGAWAVIVAFSGLVASSNGTAIGDWARGSANYVLLIPAIWIGVDAARHSNAQRTARVLIVFTGALAAVGMATFWLHARGIGTLSLDYVALPSSALVALAMALLFSRYCLGLTHRTWRKGGAILMIAFLLAGALVTGSRTELVLPIALLACMSPIRGRAVPIARGIRILLVVATAGLLGALVVGPAVISSPGYLQGRFASLISIFENGVGSDLSGASRIDIYRQSYDVWRSAPLTGIGAGSNFRGAFLHVDTPLIILAQLGIIGAIGFVVLSCLWWRSARQLRMYEGISNRCAYATSRGFALCTLLLLPFGVTFEDKGLALAVCLATVLCCRFSSGQLASTRRSETAGVKRLQGATSA